LDVSGSAGQFAGRPQSRLRAQILTQIAPGLVFPEHAALPQDADDTARK
jgi:hypothetical protein